MAITFLQPSFTCKTNVNMTVSNMISKILTSTSNRTGVHKVYFKRVSYWMNDMTLWYGAKIVLRDLYAWVKFSNRVICSVIDLMLYIVIWQSFCWYFFRIPQLKRDSLTLRLIEPVLSVIFLLKIMSSLVKFSAENVTVYLIHPLITNLYWTISIIVLLKIIVHSCWIFSRKCNSSSFKY